MIPHSNTGVATFGRQKFFRDMDGVWRYASTGVPVPGAEDMTISNFYNFRILSGFVEVPIGLAHEELDLRFALKFSAIATGDYKGRKVIRVPVDVWDQHAYLPIGMWAPEIKR